MSLPATDNFVGTNGDPLSANWTIVQGIWQIFNNSANENAVAFPNLAIWDADVFPNDQYSQAVINSSGNNGGGLAVRFSLVAVTGYSFRMTPGVAEITIERNDGAGINSDICQFTGVTIADGDVWRFSIIGSTLSLKQNGVALVPNSGSLVDATYSSGSAGMSSRGNSGILFDTWEGGSLETPPAGFPFVTTIGAKRV
jgi:hypothetical protein